MSFRFHSLAAAGALALVSGCATARTPPAPRRTDAEVGACVERLIAARGLNRYGDRPDVMYPGGTPLFDEATGESVDWLAYMRRRHPELVAPCE